MIFASYNNDIRRIREVCDSHNGMRACVYTYIIMRIGRAETRCQKKMNREWVCVYHVTKGEGVVDAADAFFRVFTFPSDEFHRDPRKCTNDMFDTS